MPGAERYIEQYRARMAAGGGGDVAPADRRRMLALTAAFTPMVAVVALPATVVAGVVASIVGNVTVPWVGTAVLVPAVVGLGYLTARWAAKYDDVAATRGWRRWLPLAATVVVVGLCLTEIISGSHAPDPVIGLWFASALWVVAFLPLATGVWGPARRALWAVGPAVTLATIVFVLTQGFFEWRFARAVPDFDVLAQQVADGDNVPDGTHAGGFTVRGVNVRRVGKTAGCDVELRITGWHAEDTRYIAHCVEDPIENFADFTHLAGDWWELED